MVVPQEQKPTANTNHQKIVQNIATSSISKVRGTVKMYIAIPIAGGRIKPNNLSVCILSPHGCSFIHSIATFLTSVRVLKIGDSQIILNHESLSQLANYSPLHINSNLIFHLRLLLCHSYSDILFQFPILGILHHLLSVSTHYVLSCITL